MTWHCIWIFLTWTQDPFSAISSQSTSPDISEQTGKWKNGGKAGEKER
jgi:hypothetical protein